MAERTRIHEVAGFSERLRLYTEGLYDRFKIKRFPTNAGWSTAKSGSGAIYQLMHLIYLGTGTTALSEARAYQGTYGLNSGDIHYSYVDWTRRLEFEFTFSRINSDVEATARIQLKETQFEGALAGRGIGLEIANYRVRGEGYGTSRGTIDLGDIPDSRIWHVKIVLEGDRLEFWINRVLQGVLTGDSVPQVQGTTGGYLVLSVINGPTGGVDVKMTVADIAITQEW